MSLFPIIRDFLNQGLFVYRNSRSGFRRIATRINADSFRVFPREAKSRSESEALYYGTKRSASINKGYTLIEILIVIIIVGLIIGVVFVVFGPAKEQARDARISSDLIQLQNIAENIYLEDGDYGNLDCATGPPELQALCGDVVNQGSSVEIRLSSLDDTYCAFAYFDPPIAKVFCVDYKGFTAKTESIVPCESHQLCAELECQDFTGDGVIDGDDQACITQCFGADFTIDPPSVPGACGSDPLCSPCTGFECEKYDVSGDRRITLFDDSLSLMYGDTCE